MTAATTPIAKPATIPATARTGAGRSRLWLDDVTWVQTKAAAISTSSDARTLCKVTARIRVAQEAPGPGAGQAADEQINHHGPMRADGRESHRDQAGGQRSEHHGQIHRLVEDDGFESEKPEQTDE